MTKTTGAYAFVIIIMILAVGFSYVILSPTDVARNLMKSGDSIVDVPSGIETRTYLRKKILLLSLHSGFVEGLCMGISLWLVITNRVPETAAMIPMNLMLLTSFVVQIVQELRAYYLYDAYSFFL
jgi:preprotein translocase subunit SecY